MKTFGRPRGWRAKSPGPAAVLGIGLALLTILSLASTSGPAGPQASPARLLQRVEISTDEPDARHVESVLAVNPRDPQNLVAAAMVLGSGESVAVYASRDGGKGWIRTTHGRDRSTRFDGLDPAVAFDRDGVAYFLAAGAELAVWKSTDGGFTWGTPSIVPGRAWDRPWIACDPGGGSANDRRVYVAGKLPVKVFGHLASDIIAVSASRDRGASFPFPRLLLPAPEKDLLNVVSDLVVTNDGGVLMTLQLFPPAGLREALLTGNYSTILSDDGGRTFTVPRPGPEFRVYGHAREGKSLFALGGVRMAVDASGGPRTGWLYLTWLDAVADGFYRVFAASSRDGGASWSEPVRVSDSATETDASTVSVAVDGSGTVGVSWYDRRGDATNGCYQLYFSASRDGGATFSANQRLDPAQTCPLASGSGVGGPPPRDEDPIASEYRFKNGGDTQGLVGLPEGGFHLAWIQAGSREMQLWSATLVVTGSTATP